LSEERERARLFVALELPLSARSALSEWRDDVLRGRSGLRAVPVDALHVTLCFLGHRWADEVAAIGAACDVVAGEDAVSLSIGRAVWLPPRRPGVLAVELVDERDRLGHVQATLSRALQGGGWYAPESRPFFPHVTVARVGKGTRVRREELPAPPALSLTASTVTLFRSRLGPGGARYEALHSVTLGASPGAADPISVVRRFHAAQGEAYAGGSLASLRELLTDDVVWHVPGASAIAGEHRGIEAVLAYFDQRRRLTDHTFTVTVHGAAVIAGRVVQLAGGRAVRDGRTMEWETVGVFRIADGRIAECWLVPFDLNAFDEIWAS
jgi:RNA 2',3'-cyclic 3'-phosphodiesterase